MLFVVVLITLLFSNHTHNKSINDEIEVRGCQYTHDLYAIGTKAFVFVQYIAATTLTHGFVKTLGLL